MVIPANADHGLLLVLELDCPSTVRYSNGARILRVLDLAYEWDMKPYIFRPVSSLEHETEREYMLVNILMLSEVDHADLCQGVGFFRWLASSGEARPFDVLPFPEMWGRANRIK